MKKLLTSLMAITFIAGLGFSASSMAMKHMAHITSRLLAAGRAEDEPVAIVCDASTDRQRVLETSLGAACADLATSGAEPPAIVVIGQVVHLRQGLDWLGALSGRALNADPLALRRREIAG